MDGVFVTPGRIRAQSRVASIGSDGEASGSATRADGGVEGKGARTQETHAGSSEDVSSQQIESMARGVSSAGVELSVTDVSTYNAHKHVSGSRVITITCDIIL